MDLKKGKIIMAEKKEEKAKKGSIRPVFQQVGYEVCEKAAEKPDEEVWIPTEKYSEAIILSEALKKKA